MSLSDAKAMKAIGRSRNMMVPWYLMASYAYYVLDTPILADATFDELCAMLESEWDQIEHVHKTWIDYHDLAAGTRMSVNYPGLAKGAACALAGRSYHPAPELTEGLRQCATAIDALSEQCSNWSRRLAS